MADFPAVSASLPDEITRLCAIEVALSAWIDGLLNLPRRDGARRQVEGSAPAVGASEIVAVTVDQAGDRMGHTNIRERALILTYQVLVRFNGTLDEYRRRVARYSGVAAWAALDASQPPELTDLGAVILPSSLSSWGAATESAHGRAVEGAFTVQVQTNIRVAE